MDKKEIVADFLRRCITYSDESITRKKARGETEEISAWQSYRDFTAYSLKEIYTGELDDWFEEEKATNLLDKYHEVSIDELEHSQRATWLSGLLSPRPLVVAASENAEGMGNLAPLSSVMVVSNTPPLLVASLSESREGRPRDTLVNLRTNGKAILHLLPATKESAENVDLTATSLPADESEWDICDFTNVDGNDMLIGQAVAAIQVSLVEERELPQAVAKLVILKVEKLFVSDEELPLNGLRVLCQHGIDRMTESPDSWSVNVDKHHN
ncbi:MAG: flavin reductase [Candidatus Poseidoniaceae archaeon]|nr:flavin reductase [Candidatus Poseidoniaceae archaeon]